MNCAFIERTIKPSKRDALNKSLALNCTKKTTKNWYLKKEKKKKETWALQGEEDEKKTDLKKREK